MSEMVERVLVAIRETVVFAETSGGISIANPEDVARAAIKAMREPTEAMLKAVEGEIRDWDSRLDSAETIAACAIGAYIDAALK